MILLLTLSPDSDPVASLLLLPPTAIR